MIPITERGNSVRITVQVQPRAAQNEIVGEHGAALKVRIAAPPVDGAANFELVRYFAKLLSLPVSSVRIVAGENARRKVVEMDNVSTAVVIARLLSPSS
jgi:uncharacterized protein (TIGR00251 family)